MQKPKILFSKKSWGKPFVFIITILLISSVFTIPQTRAQDSKLKVSTSIELLQVFVENIGGDLVEVNSIVDGNDDPHTYEPTPSEINALVQADILFIMGVQDLEPWWGGSDDGSTQGDSGLKGQILQDNPDLIVVETVNSSMMENDPLIGNIPNPHVWTSPYNAKDMCEIIYENLSAKFTGADLQTLTNNYNNYINTLDELIQEVNGNKTSLQGMKVIVNHPAMKYLYDLLGIQVVGVIEEQHGVEPSAQHIQELKELMINENVHYIVHQSNLDIADVAEIARDTDSKIIFSAPLIGMPGNDSNRINTYEDLIRYNIWALKNPQDPPAAESIPGMSLISLTVVSVVAITFIIYSSGQQKLKQRF